jgi:hypothetical protein
MDAATAGPLQTAGMPASQRNISSIREVDNNVGDGKSGDSSHSRDSTSIAVRKLQEQQRRQQYKKELEPQGRQQQQSRQNRKTVGTLNIMYWYIRNRRDSRNVGNTGSKRDANSSGDGSNSSVSSNSEDSRDIYSSKNRKSSRKRKLEQQGTPTTAGPRTSGNTSGRMLTTQYGMSIVR